MSQDWLNSVCREVAEDSIDCSILKTIVYKKSKRWEIHLNTSRYITYHRIKSLEQRFKDKYPDILDIVIQIKSSKPLSELIEDFTPFWDDLKHIIGQKMPSVSSYLDQMEYEWSEKQLVITVADETALDLCQHRQLNVFIENWLSQVFSADIGVRFHCSDPVSSPDNGEYFKQKELEDRSIIRQAMESLPISRQGTNQNSDDGRFKPGLVYGKFFKDQPVAIETLREDSGRIAVEGLVFDIDSRELRGGKLMIIVDVTDYTGSITAKIFTDKDKAKDLLPSLKTGVWFRIKGECQYDKYQKEIVLMANDVLTAPMRIRVDEAEEKRVELHMHTQMSAMDGVSSVSALIERAAFWGHKALAITDHGVVQAFPEAYALGKKKGVKILLGVEAYLVNDLKPIVQHANGLDFSQTLVVLDIETTGLNEQTCEIIEIGAVKIVDRQCTETYHSFVSPRNAIPVEITKLTGIDDSMVAQAPTIDTVMKQFLDFCGSVPLVAHNSSFDLGFIRIAAMNLGVKIINPVIDTLALSRELLPKLKRHKLKSVADHLGIMMKKQHRAVEDAQTTGHILLKLFEQLNENGIHTLEDINGAYGRMHNLNGLENNHAILLVKNAIGLKNLYTLISESHMNYYYRKPRIPKSLLMRHREGLMLGSGCEAGELYKAILKNLPKEEVLAIAKFYDYFEIQPLGNNDYLIREGQVKGEEDLKEINRRILILGRSLDKRVVATGDVHFLDPQDEYYRRILMRGQGFADADTQPPLYYKTTPEMLKEFAYLGEQESYQVVVTDPNAISMELEDIQPIPSKLCPPEIPGAEQEVSHMARETATSIYGEPLPELVEKRLTKELNSIIQNGFAVLYLIAHKLVKKSMSDGYLVGSRGSVGSSFVATMTGITEVNPLPPHYVCPVCKHSDFDVDAGKYGCGADLPDKCCPKCSAVYLTDGYDIPFEVFLGFKGDKVPDIDLNFSGEYQAIAHKYTEELFGAGYVFRAGTIGTIADKTAFGFVKKYMDEKGIVSNNAEIKRLVSGCTGVKRTTGQHPGGILVVPKSRTIYEFTPVQYPADDKESGTITSHFDFHAIHDTLVKLDILGHDDPTVIRMLEDITGVDARNISIGEEKTMQLFSSTDPLGIRPEDINSPIGTFGIPEFGTKFVRQMLLDTMPSTFAELIRISGLSHGTDVWLNNAQSLIKANTATLSEVISTRDDIMVYLIYRGLEPTIAFNIMENVRKGKGLTQEYVEEMKKNGVPDWYIDSCSKIKYMFPKAHAAAYVIMAFRIAYFKVYYPEAFYATYFTVRADDFDAALILGGNKVVREHIKTFESKGNDLSTKEKNLLTILEVALEMVARGYHFLAIDLYASHATKFLIREHGILPPLNALQGVGTNAANNIMEARESGDFLSIEDFRERAKVTKTVIEALKTHGVLKNMPDTSQISLF